MLPYHLSGHGTARRITLPLFERLPGVAHGFTVKGSIPPDAVAGAVGRPMPLLTLRQVHGAEVRLLGDEESLWGEGADRPQGDALLTRRIDAAIGIAVADCVPILLADPVSGWAGAVHAGWRGTAAGVLRAAIAALTARGVPVDALYTGIGPSIGPCCFEVGEEVVEALLRSDPEAGASVRRGAAKPRVDLVELNRRQALAAGVRSDRIAAAGLCTVCHEDMLESYRRSRGAQGRMIGFVTRTAPPPLTS
ncbi:MAG TPA: peptidoglycan editing factor PgeF [Candidatus Polarisedimenticolia bacterium]|nr:peptidoglycan editing factor PgeF [Candidatus Polarisedimenticolia bacterium]